MSIAERLLPEFDQEMASTRKLLACFPDVDLSWKPHPKSMALDRLAGHVAEMPYWGLNALTLDSLDITPQPGQSFQAAVAKSREELLAFFDKNVAETRAALEKASDDYLQQTWTLHYQGRTLVSMPRIGILRTLVINHMIHHRAQLGVYFRLRNIAVPGMYGPSADEMQSMSAS